MQPYKVGMTDTAERSYLQLHTRAQEQLEAGQDNHPSVTTFEAIQNAMSVTLTSNPCDPSRTLAGTFSVIYKLGLGTASISYVASDAHQEVVVLTISETANNQKIRKWLNRVIATGEIDGLLEKLGLDKPCLRIPDSGYLH